MARNTDKVVFLVSLILKDRLVGPNHPPLQWVLVSLSLGVKRPGRTMHYSSASCAEFKNEWI
jgi:hypothetical protein